ncbi:MAG: hypothetical protein H3C31_03005 [Brumimicrobium sp.]|nr:hypothetical protein [Brumimicrobium sp.]MCO5268569.1 hypothetical protein [Brumimicrobium sp.]
MKTYTRIMQLFWLTMGIFIAIIVTYKGFTDGFRRWYPYYVFSALALFLYFIRSIMLKRMNKIQEENTKNS